MVRNTDSLAARLAIARRKRKLTQRELAAAVSMKQPDISKIEQGKILQTTGIARIAQALAVPPLWLELGQGDEPNWDHRYQLPTMTPVLTGVAHPLIHLSLQTAPSVTWEQLMSEDRKGALPATFTVIIPDDAMAPRARSGDECLFRRSSVAKPGAGVLVRDSEGAIHFRQFRQAREPGHWEAHAENPNYATLYSSTDGLEIVAVLRAVLRGWEDL